MPNLTQNLNPKQLEAVMQKKGPVLIIAGAGTGKTTVITTRLAWLIQKKLARPEEILALTFTEKAASEMEERIDKILPYGYFDLWVSTFHAFCDRILKESGLDIGLSLDYKLLTQTDQWILMKENLEKFDLDYYKPLGNPTQFIHALISHFSRLKDENIKPQEYLEYAENLKENIDAKMDKDSLFGEKKKIIETANAFHTYQNLLLENNFLDFGDLINYTLDLFQKRPKVLEKFKKQFKYILVDEFQDTNWAQYELIKILSSQGRGLTVVADDDQAIYRFRGASTSNVLNFTKDFPQLKTIVLQENYRSKQNILDLAYNFIQFNNPDRLETKSVSQSINPVRDVSHASPPATLCEAMRAGPPAMIAFRAGQRIWRAKPLSSRREGRAGEAFSNGVKQINLSKHLKSHTGPKGVIRYFQYSNLEEQSQKVIEKIEKIILASKEKMTYSDFAILSRTNNGLEPFINQLDRNNIPYLWYSSRGLYQKKVILDLLAYFKLLDSYHESSALFRVLNLPIFKIAYEDIIQINLYAQQKGVSIFQVLKEIENGKIFIANKANSQLKELQTDSINSIKKLLNLIKTHSQLIENNHKPSEILLNFLNDSGYLKYIEKQAEQEKRDNFNYLNQFYRKIQKFEASPLTQATLKNFLLRLEAEMQAGDTGSLEADLESGPEAVRVMTIHAAKGLEFNYVFVVDVVDKRFPTIERKEPIEIPKKLIKEILPQGDAHLQEERRLFYVACTRAKNGLFFTSAQDYGGARAKKPSRFLIEAKIIKEKKEQKDDLQKQNLDIFGGQTPQIKKDRPSALKNKFEYKLSFTRFKAFNTCPKQYKYQFILHIPTKGSYTHSFGTSMHNTMLKLFQKLQNSTSQEQVSLFNSKIKQSKKENFSWKELKTIYESCWIDAWYDNEREKTKYFKKGLKELKKFYQLHKNHWPNVLFLEKGFNLKLGEWKINGRIDRVDKLADNAVEIIDYKTSKAQEKPTGDKKDQLVLYQWAAEEILGLKVKKSSYYFFENNSNVAADCKTKDIEKLKQRFIQTGEKIKASDFAPRPGYHCQFCDFKEICDERQI